MTPLRLGLLLACARLGAALLAQGRPRGARGPPRSPKLDQHESAVREALRGCRGIGCAIRYVAFNDSSFEFHHVSSSMEEGVVVHELAMQSLRWMEWYTRMRHWTHKLYILVPKSLTPTMPEASWATLVLNDMDVKNASSFAISTNTITIILSDLPPIDFDIRGNRSNRTDEEWLKAFSWKMYASHPEQPDWPIEMPSAKATLRAMDVAQEFMNEQVRKIQKYGSPGWNLSNFVVVGASKRAMAAYMACAVDPVRVKAIVPTIISMRFGLSGSAVRPGRRKHPVRGSLVQLPSDRNGSRSSLLRDPYDAFYIPESDLMNLTNLTNRTGYDSFIGGMSDFMDPTQRPQDLPDPYRAQGLMGLLPAVARRVYSIVDPYYYIERLAACDKLVLNVGRDTWFSPDTTRKYYADLPGSKSLMVYGPSTHYDLYNHGFKEAMEAWVNGLVLEQARPEIGWEIDVETGKIRAWQVSNHTPTSVQFWTAASKKDSHMAKREPEDWVRSRWSSRPVSVDDAEGHWQVDVQGTRSRGRFRAGYLEFKYPAPRPGGAPWRLTTEVSVVPSRHITTRLLDDGMIVKRKGKYEYV